MERSIGHFVISICCLLFTAAGSSAWQSSEQRSPTDSNIAELISTPRWNSAAKDNVRIRGTISVVAGMSGAEVINPNDKSFCVEDDSAGIWVRVKQAVDEGVLEDSSVLDELQAGITVEIEGGLQPGGFAPVVVPRRIAIVGPGTLQMAIHTDLKDLFRGAYIMRRVTVAGVVQNVTDDSPGWLVRVETGAGHFLTRLPKTAEWNAPEDLMDAEIRVTGVAGASRNWRSQFVCPRIRVAKQTDVEILRPPAGDPFLAKRVRVDELDGFSPSGRSLHRRSLEGEVTYYDGDRTVYVVNDGIGIRLELNQPATDKIRVGDWIEASGFIDSTRYLRGLRGTVVKATGKRQEVVPVNTTVSKIIDDHNVPTWKQQLTKTYDGRLVTMGGEVLGFDAAAENSINRIEVACDDGGTFTASLHAPMAELATGSRVELTGIAMISYGSDSTLQLAEPGPVDLLLRSPGDIKVVRKPSWWTAERIAYALAAAVVLAGLAFVWAVTLNRRVAKQTQQLASEMRSRRDAAIEFQAAIRERTQLAANIYDTVLQTLAGIGCQLDACGQNAPPNSATGMYLKTAGRMVQGGQEDLRNIVSALHCLPLDDQTFGESVTRVVKRLQRTSVNGAANSRDGEDVSRLGLKSTGKPTITVDCAKDLPRLADFIAGNLLLIIQEATRNAIKHAAASSIHIRIESTRSGSGVLISVEDDGNGFDTKTRPRPADGHFGLETMKGRAERIGGALTVESEPGKGTRVAATAPVKSFDEAIT